MNEQSQQGQKERKLSQKRNENLVDQEIRTNMKGGISRT